MNSIFINNLIFPWVKIQVNKSAYESALKYITFLPQGVSALGMNLVAKVTNFFGFLWLTQIAQATGNR